MRYALVHLSNDDKTNGWNGGAVTDRRGEFAIPYVPAGRYIVYVESPGILKPHVDRGAGSDLARLRLSGEPFTEAVVNGTDSVDVKVEAIRGGVITGRVVTEDDQPLPNADIKLLKREDGKWRPLALGGRYTSDDPVKTDPSGVYRVAGLVAGEYLVRVSEGELKADTRFQPEQDTYANGFFMAAYYPASITLKDAQAVTVTEGSESTGIDIRMPERPAHTISGTLKFGPDDGPARYAEVLIERVDEVGYSDMDMTGFTAQANDEGKWEVRGLPAGDYTIKFRGSVQVGEADRPSYVVVAPKRISVRVEYDDVVVPEIELSEGSSISGKVKWGSERPKNSYAMQPQAIPATKLSALDSAPESPNGLADAISAMNVAENGEFWILGVPAGKYAVRFVGYDHDQYYVQSITRKGVDLKQSLLKVGEDSDIKDVVITLASDFATVEGQLTQPEGSAKLDLEHAIVIVAPANEATRRFNGGLMTMQPDARGKFVFKCPPGEYFLLAVTAAEIKQLPKPMTEDYFKKDNQKFERLKVKGSEKVKCSVTVR